MATSRVPAAALWFLALFLVSGALRIWSAIAFPLIDITDAAPLWAALVTGVVIAAVLAALAGTQPWIIGRATPLAARSIVALAGFALGVSLGDGAYRAANALFDRAPVRWVAYTVDGHPRGRNGSRLALRTTGVNGFPIELWIRDRRATADLPMGTRVEVPIRPGAFGRQWLDGDPRAVQ